MAASSELSKALDAIRGLKGDDFLAIKSWMQGEGRAKLRDRGATDEQIGAARIGTDLYGDSQYGGTGQADVEATSEAVNDVANDADGGANA